MKTISRFFLFLFFTAVLYGQERGVPLKGYSFFHFDQPATLGLSFARGRETITIFSPRTADNKYNNGVVLFPFKGMLYAQWQCSALDEDAEDTHVTVQQKLRRERLGQAGRVNTDTGP